MPNQIGLVRDRINKLSAQIDKTNFKLPVNGQDLLDLGFPKNNVRSIALNAVQEEWYENPNITREEALEILKRVKLEYSINETREMMNKINRVI